MVVMYKERLSEVFEVVLDVISGYYEIYKNGILVSAVQDIIDATAVFNTI